MRMSNIPFQARIDLADTERYERRQPRDLEGSMSATQGILLTGATGLLGRYLLRDLLTSGHRGVGRSQGPAVDVARHVAEFWKTSHVAGEMDLRRDVQGAALYLRPLVGPTKPLVLIGYSFGCALLPSIRLSEPPAAFVLIAPPLAKHDYGAFATIKTPLLAIVSEDDFTTEPELLRQWFDRLPAEKKLVQTPLGNHFFRGRESWLVETVADFLREHVG